MTQFSYFFNTLSKATDKSISKTFAKQMNEKNTSPISSSKFSFLSIDADLP